MRRINEWMDAGELAGLVCEALRCDGLEVVLVGEAVASVYSEYERLCTRLDFLTIAPERQVERVMKRLGFNSSDRVHYRHPDAPFEVAFRESELMLCGQPLRKWMEMNTPCGTLALLDPTQCIMERLSAHRYEDAIAVARCQPVKLGMIQKWAASGDLVDEFELFRSLLEAEAPATLDLAREAVRKL